MNKDNEKENIPPELQQEVLKVFNTAKDRVRACRLIMNQNPFLRAQAIEELKRHYVNSPANGGLTYNCDDYFDYYDDYTERGITTVLDFVKKSLQIETAFEETLEFLTAILASTSNKETSEKVATYETAAVLIEGLNNFKESNFEHSNPFGEVIILTKKEADRENLCDENCPISLNVKAWSQGDISAGNYLMEIMKKDMNAFMEKVIDKLPGSSALELMEWMITSCENFQYDPEVPALIASAQYIKAGLSKNPNTIASVVEDAYNFETLESLVQKFKQLLSELINTRALIQISSAAIEFIYLNLRSDELSKPIKLLEKLILNPNEHEIFSELYIKLRALEQRTDEEVKSNRSNPEDSILSRIWIGEAPEGESRHPKSSPTPAHPTPLTLEYKPPLPPRPTKPPITHASNNNNNNYGSIQNPLFRNNNLLSTHRHPLQFSFSSSDGRQKQGGSYKGDPNNNNNNYAESDSSDSESEYSLL